jgi:hypothetical protein
MVAAQPVTSRSATQHSFQTKVWARHTLRRMEQRPVHA